MTVSGGEALVRLLARRGVDCLFGTPGSEFGPLIEAAARGEGPRPVGAPHEFLAASMAHGHYLGSGRCQAVMVHVTVGTATALGALINAGRMDVPMLFMAGRTPLSEEGRPGSRDRFVHWAQEAFDPGAPLREYVRWDYELRDPRMLGAVVDRALAVAQSPPAGPVSLVLPRELLLEPCPDVDGPSTQPPAHPPAPDPRAVEDTARDLLEADRPLVVTGRLGRDPEAVALLVEAADRLGLGVVTPHAQYVCFPSRHPAFLGYGTGPLARADLVLTLDEDVPWIPVQGSPAPGARVVQVGVDPLFRRIPVRTHRADRMVTAEPRLFLRALLDEVGEARRPARWEAAGPPARAPEGLGPRAVAAALADLWFRDLTVFNELSLPPEPLPLDEPGQYYRSGSGSCLGWGPGAALGFKLARPGRTVVAVVGDGAWLFANPLACHQVAMAEGLATLTVVLANGTAASIREATRQFRPGGAADREGRFPFADLAALPAFHRVMEACGGLGLRVDRPEGLSGALAAGLEAVREGRPALVEVACPEG